VAGSKTSREAKLHREEFDQEFRQASLNHARDIYIG
jgi:hypothetical protein